uniref:Uncharacterized protein n=1 Tax=Sphaerodactylus townsendi TaxID=933632 RepID=A0ACB8EB89_9SAUR
MKSLPCVHCTFKLVLNLMDVEPKPCGSFTVLNDFHKKDGILMFFAISRIVGERWRNLNWFKIGSVHMTVRLSQLCYIISPFIHRLEKLPCWPRNYFPFSTSKLVG